MGNWGEKAGGDGKRGGEPWEGNEEREGDERATGREGKGPHDEINPCCREVPFSIPMASQQGTAGWKQPHE